MTSRIENGTKKNYITYIKQAKKESCPQWTRHYNLLSLDQEGDEQKLRLVVFGL